MRQTECMLSVYSIFVGFIRVGEMIEESEKISREQRKQSSLFSGGIAGSDVILTLLKLNAHLGAMFQSRCDIHDAICSPFLEFTVRKPSSPTICVCVYGETYVASVLKAKRYKLPPSYSIHPL